MKVHVSNVAHLHATLLDAPLVERLIRYPVLSAVACACLRLLQNSYDLLFCKIGRGRLSMYLISEAVKKMKALEEENAMLNRIFGQKESDITALKAVVEKK